MKRLILILLALASFLMVSCKNQEKGTKVEMEQTAGKIVYFNLDKVLQDYELAKEIRARGEKKVQGIQDEIKRRGMSLEKDLADFNEKISKGLITQSVAEIKGQKLQEQKYNLDQYTGIQQEEVLKLQQEITTQIAESIKTFLDEYQKEKQFSMILSTQGEIMSLPVCVAAPDLDITEELLSKLNEKYLASKKENK